MHSLQHMRIYYKIFFLGFFLASSGISFGQSAGKRPPANPQELRPTFYELLDSQWDYLMHEYPEWATDLGYPGQNDRWTDMSLAAVARREDDANEFIKVLRADNRKRYLDEEGKFDYDLIMYSVQDEIDGYRFHDELLPINQLNGIQQDIPYRLSTQPNKTIEDYHDILNRMRAVPLLIDQVIALMNKGIEMHITQPKITMRDVPDQVKSLLSDNPKNSPMMSAFTNFPITIPEHDRATLTSMALQIYRDSLVPAVKRLHKYLLENYLPNCRESIAMKDLPDGKAWYEYKVRHHTTTTMKAEQIFDLGKQRVTILRDRMDSVMHVVGFQGTLPKFFEYLRTDPKFFYTDSASLINGYKEIAAHAQAELPKLFGKLPKLNFVVTAVPAYSQKSQTTAYYNQGSLKAGRPAYFYANTYDLASRPKWEMEPLTLHESVPGHHLQIALAQELVDKPDILKNADYTAFVEGWAFYAESLGPELGFYTNPYSKMGQLTYAMWRVMRLVVDVGIHYKGWTRDQAINFFAENSGKSRHDIEVEIDRYIVDPAQALSYKIGDQKIKDIRAYAQKELGEKFDVRAFHDELLGAGALPLNILEQRMKKWTQELQKKNSGK